MGQRRLDPNTIDAYELKQALSNLVDAKNQTLQNMMNDIEKNQSRTIDFDEFIEIMTAKTLEKDNPEGLIKVFYILEMILLIKLNLNILKELLRN